MTQLFYHTLRRLRWFATLLTLLCCFWLPVAGICVEPAQESNDAGAFPGSQEPQIATFAAAPYTSAGAIDLDQVRYIRVTNLDLEAQVELAVVTTASNYQVRLTAGASHILARANESALAEEDTTPSFGTMENLASIQIRPIGATLNPRIEIFVGVA